MLTKQRIIEILKQANELNGDWKPDWENLIQPKWSINYNSNFTNDIEVFKCYCLKNQLFYFESRRLAVIFINLFDKDEILQILNLNQITLLQLLEEK